jgi:hypothetical protein
MVHNDTLAYVDGLANGYKGAKLYPPANNRDLRQLHHLVVTSTAQEHLKQSVIFYLLKDLSTPEHNFASEFAEECFLSHKYWTFIEGLWSLDRLRYQV